MSDMSQWLLLIPLLPLLAAAVILALGEAVLRRWSHLPCVLAIAASCVLSIFVLGYVRVAGIPEHRGLERRIEALADAERQGEDHLKESVRLLGRLGYYDLRDRARELADEPLAGRKAALEKLLLQARERHAREAGHPYRVLYAKYTWIAASPTFAELEQLVKTVHDVEAEEVGASLPAVTSLLQRMGYTDLRERADKLADAEDEQKKSELEELLLEARQRSSPDPLVSTARISFGLRADSLSSIMLVMITSIATLIAIYSSGYMHGDPGYPRFFAAVSLFVFSMCMLVLGDNFGLLFLGWEGVGLCSYLLIGFWHEKPSAADAARKAFLVTRLGDVGLFLGILMLWLQYGSLEYDTVFQGIIAEVNGGTANHAFLMSAALLLFCGAVGKSAQFPLHVWLPDAMEGPTPVSALIHAATMVTAGVYLVARCTPLYMAVPEAQLVVACTGGITMLLAALIALTQNDLKRVLAYSTLSQLGYMFLALGCALRTPGKSSIGPEVTHGLVPFAVTAAMFHLFTHAFFKALLFLAAGSVMHAMHHVIDMRRFSGLRKVLPYTHWTFLAGAVSLAALPLTSGFWSKDEILAAAEQASHHAHGSVATAYTVLLAAGIVTAALTAFYTFRAYFKTFWGELKLPPETHGHAHESPSVMTIPLMILAVPALFVGGLLGPVTHGFAKLLEKVPYMPHAVAEHANLKLMAISTAAGLLGVALAWFMYIKQPALPGQLAARFPALYQVSLNKFFFDEIYLMLLVRPAEGLARFIGSLDLNAVDAFVDLVGQVPRLIGGLFRPVQNGLVQFYALAMILGLTVFLLALVRSL